MTQINTDQLAQQMRMMAAQASGTDLKMSEESSTKFADLLGDAVNKVNDQLQESGNLKAAYEQGIPDVSLVDVMLASQKAGLAFQATVQVRNKLVSAYEDIMNMPI